MEIEFANEKYYVDQRINILSQLFISLINIPLLPIWNNSGKIDDPELFQKSTYNGRYAEVMLKEIPGAAKPPQGEMSNDKVKGRINKDDKESDGGDDREDPPD